MVPAGSQGWLLTADALRCALARLKAAPGDPTNTAADAIDSLVDAMLDE